MMKVVQGTFRQIPYWKTSADRGKEEDNFDGTSGSIEKEVSVLPDGTKHVAKERDLSNRPNNYSTMGIRNGVM